MQVEDVRLSPYLSEPERNALLELMAEAASAAPQVHPAPQAPGASARGRLAFEGMPMVEDPRNCPNCGGVYLNDSIYCRAWVCKSAKCCVSVYFAFLEFCWTKMGNKEGRQQTSNMQKHFPLAFEAPVG